MELADFIRTAQRPPALPLLIIGGLAVAAHGHVRATFDADFLVRRADRDAWHSRLLDSGLKLFGETNAFAQFHQPEGDGLDLMFVDQPTFDGMWQASEERDFGGIPGRVPCLDHLLALKLHALKQALPHRTSRDAEDVEMLARRNGLDLRDRHYEQLFLKYATRDYTKPSSGSSESHEAAAPCLELNLPDGEGFRSLPPRVSLARMIQRNRELRRWFPGGIRTAEERWKAKTTEEFHL